MEEMTVAASDKMTLGTSDGQDNAANCSDRKPSVYLVQSGPPILL